MPTAAMSSFRRLASMALADAYGTVLMRMRLPLVPCCRCVVSQQIHVYGSGDWTTGPVPEQPSEGLGELSLPVWYPWLCHCAGSELVIGPWSHSGFLDNRVGHVRSGRRSRFNHLTHAISFFDRCCGHTTDAETIAELAGADATDSTKGEE